MSLRGLVRRYFLLLGPRRRGRSLAGGLDEQLALASGGRTGPSGVAQTGRTAEPLDMTIMMRT
jgi:hypothetical protein